ncbi:MAG: DUF4920 domain-containing protein [Flavobacteriales bacterium]|nr:MAG: DUF4920 domain-containing protein [Flavobacteriales bacterium]
MKFKIALIISLIAITACKKEENYASFGNKITTDNVITNTEMAEIFKNLQMGDTLEVKFNATINQVCKKKGCWMKLDLGDGQESMVTFKDYGFFMPLNAANREVIVNGKAFVKETTVEELRHFAKDAGKSEKEIDSITQPKYTYAFEADGVLMKK